MAIFYDGARHRTIDGFGWMFREIMALKVTILPAASNNQMLIKTKSISCKFVP